MRTLDAFYAAPPEAATDVLAGLYDAINAMDLSQMPMLTRNEKIILRSTEKKDVFAEKFLHSPRDTESQYTIGSPPDERGGGHHAHFDLVERSISPSVRRRSSPTRSDRSGSVSSGHSSPLDNEWKEGEEEDFTAGVSFKSGTETETDDGFTFVDSGASVNTNATPRPVSRNGTNGNSRMAFDQQSLSSRTTQSTHRRHGSSNTMAPSSVSDPDSHQNQSRTEFDTHFYPASIEWRKGDDLDLPGTIVAKLDVNIPISTFPGEVGDVST